MGNPTQKDIEARAYDIWEREGRPEGRDAEHWRQAEAELSAGPGASATSTVTAKLAAPAAPVRKPGLLRGRKLMGTAPEAPSAR